MTSQNSTSVHAQSPFEALAAFNKAAGDTLRLAILRLLSTNSYGVLELSDAFDIKQSGMSHHLKVLANAGLVTTRKEGNSVFYRRAPAAGQDDACSDMKHALFQTLDGLHLPEDVLARIEHIHETRAQASAQFFAENANKFAKQQDLIATYPVYAEQVLQVLDNTEQMSKERALEIGPGEGEFLAELSTRYKTVLGIDNNPNMLEKAARFVDQSALHNVTLQISDANQLTTDTQFDCAVLNMVLHHTPSPANIFKSIANVLRSGGSLIVCELCEHDQAWVREACGDIWQGFRPDDLDHWAFEANLELKQNVYFALRNGFQIQIKQFLKPPIL